MLECLKGARADVQDIKVALEAAEVRPKSKISQLCMAIGILTDSLD